MKELLAAGGNIDAREKIILDNLLDGNIPGWVWNWRPVRVSAVVDGKSRTLEYYVTPDYVPIGTEDDWFHVPMWPGTAQKLADERNAVLPTSRMVDEIYANASARLVPSAIAGQKSSTSEWGQHEITVQRQMATLGVRPGTFLAGHKKDVVVGPSLDGSRVAIYGWHDESGQLTSGKINAPIQPYSTIHDSRYSDYAHGTRLVQRYAVLDGEPVDIVTIMKDPKLSVLVSSQGPIPGRYPSKTPLPAGSGGYAQASLEPRTASPDASAEETSRAAASSAVSLYEKGDKIKAAQMTLIALGYDLGASGADGTLGPKTKAAIVKFQNDTGIGGNGTLDATTMAELEKRARALSKGLTFWQKIGIASLVTASIAAVTVWVRGSRK